MGEFIPNLFFVFLRMLFQMVLNAILGIFASDHILLEIRGSFIVEKICNLHNSKSVYIRMEKLLSNHDTPNTAGRGKT